MGDAATLAALRRLGVLVEGEAITLTPLSGGVSCDVWRADIAGRRPLAVKRALPQLRVAAEWLAPVDRAENEVAWLRRVARIDPALVPVVVAHSPEDHLFVLDWLDPAQHPVWRDELVAGRVDPAFAGTLGGALARIHAETVGDDVVACSFGDPALFDALRIAPFLRYTAERVPEVAARLNAVADALAARRIALVHGDVSPKNILVGPRGGVFLDAECAVHGDPAFDLAFCTTHLLLKQVWLPQHRALLALSVRQFTARYLAGVSWEDAGALAARAGALVSALLLARVEGKSPAPYLDDAARTLVRARAVALLAGDTPAITDLIATWEPR